MVTMAKFLDIIWTNFFSIKLPFLGNITIGVITIAVFLICFILGLFHWSLGSFVMDMRANSYSTYKRAENRKAKHEARYKAEKKAKSNKG